MLRPLSTVRLSQDFQPGDIVQSKVSINQSILSTTMLSELPASIAQQLSIMSMESMSGSNAHKRLRPCVIMPRRGAVVLHLAALTALGGFDPAIACCRTQHYLVPLNDTPLNYTLPSTTQCPRFYIQPRSLWPNSDHGYVLAIVLKTAEKRALEPFQMISTDGTVISYRMSRDDVEHLLRWSSERTETMNNWSDDMRQKVNATWQTHRALATVINKLEGAVLLGDGVTPSQLRELDLAYERHARAVAHVNDEAVPATNGLPLQYLPAQSNLRWYLEVQTLQSFHYEYPMRNTFDFDGEQIQQVKSAIAPLRESTAKPVDEAILASILAAVIDIALQQRELVHPAFSQSTRRRAALLLRRDDELRKVLMLLWEGVLWRVPAVINYIHQEAA